MADVTNVTDVTMVEVPGLKCFLVTASDGETFTPPGFSAIGSVQITPRADPSTGNPIGYTLSVTTITIECTGASDVVMSVWVQGRQ